MCDDRIYTDLCDAFGNKLYVGDKVKFIVEPFNYEYFGVIILADGGIFIEYDFYGPERHPLYLVDDEEQDMNATIPIHYVYVKLS